MKDKSYVKDHILETTKQMLLEGYDLEAITVRKIATKANVAIGLINYHFKNKETLLKLSVENIIDELTQRVISSLDVSHKTPKDKLTAFLMEISRAVLAFEALTKLILYRDLTSEGFSTPMFLLPFLRDLRPDLDEMDRRLLSIQIVAPLQYMFLKKNDLEHYLGSQDFQVLIERHLESLNLWEA